VRPDESLAFAAEGKRLAMTGFRLRTSIGRIMMFIAAIAVAAAAFRFSLVFGCAMLAAILLFAGRKVLVKLPGVTGRTVARAIDGLRRRTVGPFSVIVLTFLIVTAPYVLFFDPIDYWPSRRHVAREPLALYVLFSDDVPYIAASRNWERTVSNLFEPHNTHIVPAWRILTWALVQAAGSLERIPQVFAVASYSILIAAMLLTGRLAGRESGRTAVGLAAMVLLGTTSLMLTPASWYSAGQPLWAGFGIVSALWYAQSYRRTGDRLALALGAIATVIAGWLWTIGHVAGPAAAVYLWSTGSRRCRRAAIVPLAATVFAVGLAIALGGRHIDSRLSFHGRNALAAANPIQGLFHTCQAIPESLVFANLGLSVQTTPGQGVLLSLLLFLAWSGHAWIARPKGNGERRFSPLECAGFAIVMMAYLVEWTFRGYMDFRYLRTMNLRFTVPWYDVVPQIGAVLLLAGCGNRQRRGPAKPPEARSWNAPTQLECLGVCLLVVALVGLNRPRVAALVRASVPSLARSERTTFPTTPLQTMRANVLLMYRALWQSRNLGQLAQCEELASRLGWGRDAIRAAFGHRFLPGGGKPSRAEDYDLYDAAALLDLPDRGEPADPAIVRATLGEFYAVEAEPRPRWISPKETWPPVDDQRTSP
jgi:hypothetical protein